MPTAGDTYHHINNAAIHGRFVTGRYQGDGVGPGDTQKITLGFRPAAIQIIVEATAAPTGLQWAKTEQMDGFEAFRQSATAAGFFADQIQIEDDGFSVRNEANASPGTFTSDYFFQASS